MATAAFDERRALGYALTSVLLWSTVATGFKLGLREMTPAQLLFLGSVVSLVVFALAHWRRRRLLPAVAPSPPRAYLQAAALGLLNPLAYYLAMFAAYERLPAQIAHPLNYIWAIVLALLAAPMLGQRLPGRVWAGMAVGYAGVWVLLTRGALVDLAGFDPVGVALILAGAVLWSLYWLLAARLRLPPETRLLTGFACATPLIGVICHFTDGLPAPSARHLAFGAWLGLVEMGVAYLLWQRALALTRRAGALSQMIFLSPFISLALIAAVLGERIHPSAVAALALIAAGAFLSRPPRRGTSE